MRFALLIFILVAFCNPAYSQQDSDNNALSIDLASDHVDITLGFNGANLSLFGVKGGMQGDVAIIVRGPTHSMVVRRKQPVMGIWVNRSSVKFSDVPVYYDFAASVPEESLANAEMRKEYGIGLDALFFETKDKKDKADLQRFREALIRNKQIQGHFPLEPKPVKYISDNFFRADFYVPPNVPTGDYIIETFLFDGDVIKSHNKTNLRVAQIGFNYNINTFAHDRGLLYGFVSVMFALLSGWSAFAFMRRG